jgi:hypothetical protein
MRYPAVEKLEIIRLVEESTPVRRTLEKLGIPRATFYPLVRSVSERRPRSSGGPMPQAGPRLEPHSGRCPRPHHAGAR